MKRAQMERGRPALLICGPSWLGDAVLSLPAIGALRERLPGCRICVAAPPALADLYRGVRAVDETICFDKRGPRKLPNILRTASRLRDKELDLALLFTRSLAPAVPTERTAHITQTSTPAGNPLPAMLRYIFLNPALPAVCGI